MTFQMSVAVRNARLDAIEATIGTSAKVMIYTGSVPANCAASTTGTLLAQFNLGSDWAAAASGGSKAFSSVPLATTAVANGTAGYYRVFASDGTTCGMQGSVTATGGGGDMTIDNVVIATSQTVNITSWVITDGNA